MGATEERRVETIMVWSRLVTTDSKQLAGRRLDRDNMGRLYEFPAVAITATHALTTAIATTC